MGLDRRDNSVESSNTPTTENLWENKTEDLRIYRGMVLGVNFVGDDGNITNDSENPQVTYNVILMGTENEGTIIDNVRLASPLGGEFNYSEKTLRAISPGLRPEVTPFQDMDGDVVYVTFLGGNRDAPVILGLGVHPKDLDKTGAAKSDAPLWKTEYNGLFFEVNNQGELTITRKGGTLDTQKVVFVPDESGNKLTISVTEQKINVTTEGGLNMELDGATDTATIEAAGGATFKAKDGQVAAGTSSIELLQQISDQLGELITMYQTGHEIETHIGNLGFLTSLPTQAAVYAAGRTQLQSIQTDVDTIKGDIE